MNRRKKTPLFAGTRKNPRTGDVFRSPTLPDGEDVSRPPVGKGKVHVNAPAELFRGTIVPGPNPVLAVCARCHTTIARVVSDDGAPQYCRSCEKRQPADQLKPQKK